MTPRAAVRCVWWRVAIALLLLLLLVLLLLMNCLPWTQVLTLRDQPEM
jgi:hypothetical protein